MGCQKGVLDLNMFFISNLWPLQALDKGEKKNISLQKGLRLVGLLELTRGKNSFFKPKKRWERMIHLRTAHYCSEKEQLRCTNPIGMS